MASGAAAPLVGDKPSEKTPLTGSSSSGGKGSLASLEGAQKQVATVFAIFALVAIAVTKTQITAALLRFPTSGFPTAYSLWTCVVTCVLLVPFFLIKPSSFAVPTKEMIPVLATIILFMTFDLGFTNIALAKISTALQQCIASTNPFWTIVLETILHQKLQHAVTYITVTLVVVGSVLASLGDGSKHDPIGLAAACAAVLCSATKYVLTHKAFSAFKGHMGALALLFWVDLLMAPIFLVWTIINGELVSMFSISFADVQTFWLMTGTAGMGGLRALTQFIVLALVTATSMSTANIFTQVLNICLSLVLQTAEITITVPLMIGIGMVMVFSAFYAFIKGYKPFLPAVDKCFGCAKPDEAPSGA